MKTIKITNTLKTITQKAITLTAAIAISAAASCAVISSAEAHGGGHHHGGGGGHHHGGGNVNAGVVIGVTAGVALLGTAIALSSQPYYRRPRSCLVAVGRPRLRCHFNRWGDYRCHRSYQQRWVAC